MRKKAFVIFSEIRTPALMLLKLSVLILSDMRLLASQEALVIMRGGNFRNVKTAQARQ